jgi:glutamine---fructose-6-phosphate transaminase (isomerizing)
MASNTPIVGTHTQKEILSQPACWTECLPVLKHQVEAAHLDQKFSAATDFLFVGCGSSYYVALAAAATWTHLTGIRARAVPASELLLFPELHLFNQAPCQPVLVSRSGHTSEVLKAARYMEETRKVRTLAISCVSGQPLEEISAVTLTLTPADEKSMVMTRSFTSMLLGLQYAAATIGHRQDFIKALESLPAQTQAAIEPLPSRLRQFVQANEFADYVFLAQGPYFGIASEAQLKVKEMSCSYAQCFHTLEFRHGPKAIVSPETLVTFFISETGYAAEREVLEEIKGLGGTTLVVTNEADAAVRGAADFLVELHLDVPEYARLVASIIPGQLLGLFTGLKKGFNPDQPRNLSRVVILDKEDE